MQIFKWKNTVSLPFEITLMLVFKFRTDKKYIYVLLSSLLAEKYVHNSVIVPHQTAEIYPGTKTVYTVEGTFVKDWCTIKCWAKS